MTSLLSAVGWSSLTASGRRCRSGRLLIWSFEVLEIRARIADDAAAFQELRLFALRECPTAFSSSYEEECDIPLTRVGERLAAAPDRAVFGAFDNGTLVGMVGLLREQHRKLSHKAVVWGVYV